MMMQGVRMIGCLSVKMKERECQCKGENEKKKVLKRERGVMNRGKGKRIQGVIEGMMEGEGKVGSYKTSP